MRLQNPFCHQGAFHAAEEKVKDRCMQHFGIEPRRNY
jgi:hypothetical protein